MKPIPTHPQLTVAPLIFGVRLLVVALLTQWVPSKCSAQNFERAENWATIIDSIIIPNRFRCFREANGSPFTANRNISIDRQYNRLHFNYALSDSQKTLIQAFMMGNKKVLKRYARCADSAVVASLASLDERVCTTLNGSVFKYLPPLHNDILLDMLTAYAYYSPNNIRCIELSPINLLRVIKTHKLIKLNELREMVVNDPRFCELLRQDFDGQLEWLHSY